MVISGGSRNFEKGVQKYGAKNCLHATPILGSRDYVQSARDFIMKGVSRPRPSLALA